MPGVVKGETVNVFFDTGPDALRFIVSRQLVSDMLLPSFHVNGTFVITYGNGQRTVHTELAVFTLHIEGGKMRIHALILEEAPPPTWFDGTS